MESSTFAENVSLTKGDIEVLRQMAHRQSPEMSPCC